MSANTPTDRLYTLPPELRNQIYAAVLFPSGTTTINTDTTLLPPNHFSLLSTSHLYHREATAYFYTHARFTLSPTAPTPYATLLPPFPDPSIPYLRHLTLDLHTARPSHPDAQRSAALITALATACTARRAHPFKNLVLCIRGARACTQFLNSRFDDSVMDVQHPVTSALLCALRIRGFAERVVVDLRGAWFAGEVTGVLEEAWGEGSGDGMRGRLEFMRNGRGVRDVRGCERRLRDRFLVGLEEYLDLDAPCSSSLSDVDEGNGEEEDDNDDEDEEEEEDTPSLTDASSMGFMDIDSDLDFDYEFHIDAMPAEACSSVVRGMGDVFPDGDLKSDAEMRDLQSLVLFAPELLF
ncbi:hypothetical protein EJ04DRAFT_576943 [Polyplosphaeria fusca]|uniref:Uncharacterized protein n=1 Tax=Polyplosphaeria fusca TaxID=682080 RepID=A0A9P4QV24_9PLEO|nr:hypothetical protein EJ04DRAFT_576943 [Polyplosphaeria fusca]